MRPVSRRDAPASLKEVWPHVPRVPGAALSLSPRWGPPGTSTRLLSAHTVRVHVATFLSRGPVYLTSLQPSCAKIELNMFRVAWGSLWRLSKALQRKRTIGTLASSSSLRGSLHPWDGQGGSGNRSALTEPVSGTTPFENSIGAAGGSSQARLCCCVKRRAKTGASVAPCFGHVGPAGRGNGPILKMTTHVMATVGLLSA